MRWRISLALILAASAGCADPLTFVRATTLAGDVREFGGLSAIEMQDPDSAIVLSDRGQAFVLKFDRSTGAITVARMDQPRPDRDSEGLAYAAGRLYFSYEGPAEIAAQSGPAIEPHPDFATLPPNRSLEALAGDADGTLYVLPERAVGKDGVFPIYRYRNKVWDIPGHMPKTGLFLPTGADIGPDGLLYVLERALSPFGFRTQIRRVDPNAPESKAEILLNTYPGQHDNLEGLAIWQSDSGATCLLMVSDDNFRAIQRSELVEYALTETLADGAHCD